MVSIALPPGGGAWLLPRPSARSTYGSAWRSRRQVARTRAARPRGTVHRALVHCARHDSL